GRDRDDRDRHPQHAAGAEGLQLLRVLQRRRGSARRDRRDRDDRADLRGSDRRPDGRLRAREVRMRRLVRATLAASIVALVVMGAAGPASADGPTILGAGSTWSEIAI